MAKTCIFKMIMFGVQHFPGFCSRVLSHRSFPFVAALIAMALAMPSVRTGLQGDDLWFRCAIYCPSGLEQVFEANGSLSLVADGDSQRNRRLMNLGLLPWWSCEDFKLSFWRPLSNMTHRLDYALWPESTKLMHLQSILWYGALTLCVSLLYRRLIPTAWVAGLAALLFAIDDAHSLPACWIAARTTVIAGFFAVVSLLLHDTWRKSAAWPWRLLALVSFALALLSKEAAIGICAYLVAYALFMDSGSIRSRLFSLLPYGLIVMIWQLAYRFFGFGVSSSELYVDPAGSPLRVLKIIIDRGPILLFGQWGFPPPEIVLILTPLARQIFWITTIVLLAGLFYILVPLLKTQRIARYLFAGMLMATVPACMGMISGRMLEYVGIGGSALLAILLYALFKQRNSSQHALDRWLCRILLPALLVIHLIFAPIGFFVTHWTFGKPLAVRQETLSNAAMIPKLAGKTVILLNPPHASYASYLQIRRALAGQPLPRHVWALAPGRFTHTQQTVSFKRLDMYRLQVEVQNGIPIQMERGRENPLCIGDRIDLDGMTVTVSDIDSAGLPRTMVFEFPVPLESPSIVWLQILEKELSPWSPPRVGETISSCQ